MGQGTLAFGRWALFARSLLPNILGYGLATEEEVLDIVERRLRDELMDARGLMPLSLPMMGSGRETHRPGKVSQAVGAEDVQPERRVAAAQQNHPPTVTPSLRAMASVRHPEDDSLNHQ